MYVYIYICIFRRLLKLREGKPTRIFTTRLHEQVH